MAKERAFLTRNTGTVESPIWEKWFAKTVYDAVLMSDADGETKNIKDYVDEQITTLIGGAPETADTLKELFELIESNDSIVEALNAAIANKADKDHTHADATQETAGFMSISDKTKLDGIEAGANKYVHPETAGNKHIPAGGAEGQILTWKADGEAQWTDDIVIEEATTEKAGLMSAADKTKLDGVEAGANKYVHPEYEAAESGLYKVEVDDEGHVSGTTAVTKDDITALGIPEENTTYEEATTTEAGLMSAADKTKLDGVAEGANNYVHPETHAATMITEDATHRFVTDEEKETWNNKANIYMGTESELPTTAPVGSIGILVS